MESRFIPAGYSYFEVKKIIRRLCAKYPFLTSESIGKTVAGREISVLKIGSAAEKVLFLGGDDPTHYLSTLILLKFLEDICYCTQKGKTLCGIDMRSALFGRTLCIIPLLNPDGLEIKRQGKLLGTPFYDPSSELFKAETQNWQSNLRGVELSRNLPFEFEERRQSEKMKGIRSAAPFGYSGPCPLSEAETLSLYNFVKRNDINHIVHLSGFGQRVSYSGLGGTASIGVKMAEIIAAVSGYCVSPPFLESDTIICDWFSNEFSRPAVLIRAGKENLNEIKNFEAEYKTLREALALSSLF